ncbi:MAG: hypothetical protein ABI818_20630 [Acidobacteriota bacterium]
MAGDSERRRFRDADHRGAPPRGARELTAMLPNGRTVWLRVAAPLAPATAVSHVSQLAETLAERRRSSTIGLAESIERLSKTIVEDAERLERARLARVGALRRRIASADNAVDARLAKARQEFRSRLARQLKIDRENIRRLRRRDLWDKILLASALPLFTAYGERGNPFGSNNLTLTISLLIWLVGDRVVEALFGSDAAKSPYALEDADAWSYIAPFGNLLAGWWLLGDRQHERFVTRVTTLKLENTSHRAPDGTIFYRYRAEVDLQRVIAKGHFEDFATFSGVTAVAAIGGIRWSPAAAALDPRIERLAAKVDGGRLRLTFRAVAQTAAPIGPYPSALGEVDVAWLVDTDKPRLPASSK